MLDDGAKRRLENLRVANARRQAEARQLAERFMPIYREYGTHAAAERWGLTAFEARQRANNYRTRYGL